MPEYLHPGVYIEETSYRGKPIEGVSTSTAGMVGRAAKGPEGVATLVTSFTDFVRTFGPAFSKPTGLGDLLGHAVQSFFNNGGLRTYIVRVLAADAQSSSSDNSPTPPGIGVALRLASTVRGPTAVLPLNSLRGVTVGSSLHIFTRPSPAVAFPPLGSPSFTATVTAYDAVRNSVTVADPDKIHPGVTLDVNNTFVVVGGSEPTRPAAPNKVPNFLAFNRGLAGNGLSILISPVDLPPVRLRNGSFARATPQLADWSTASNGPNGTVTAFTQIPLPANAMRYVRAGDTIELDGGAGAAGTPQRAVAAAGLPDVPVTVASATGNAASYAAGSTVTLTQRNGVATGAPPLTLITLGAAETLNLTTVNTTGTATTLPMLHSVAAFFQPGDRITVAGGGNTIVLTIGSVNFPASTNVGLAGAAITGDFTNGTAKLVNTPGRLLVGDASALSSPRRVPNETLSVTGGGATAPSTARFVDNATGAIWYGSGAGQFPTAGTTDANWTTADDLSVAATGDTLIPVATTAPFYTGASVAIDNGATPFYSTIAAVDPVAKTITLADALTADLSVPADAAQRKAFARVLEIQLQVFEGGVLRETFPNLSWNPDPATQSFRKYYLTRINDTQTGSGLIKVLPPATTPSALPTDEPTSLNGFPFWLGGGSDGSDVTAIDLIGHDNGPNLRTGIEALKEREDIAIVAVPGVVDVAVQEALITHCELLKYRFAVLDGPPHQSDVSKIQVHRNSYDSKYAAYYEPWLEVLDLTTGNTLVMPPSGAVMGIYARSDNERGVHKAPANEVVRSILDVELPFTAGEQDVLNPIGINLIRTFTGRGIRVWGARTVSSDQEWKYVNVRRLFIFLEHSIDIGTQWVVFEPNNESLWARVVETITAFLTGVWKTGALMGTKPEDAFFVRCDRTTMTQDDIDNGRLVCLIGVAPTMPAEFVIFRIGQFTASAKS